MKSILKLTILFLLVFTGFTSCRKESEDITERDPKEETSNNRITNDVANLIVRTTTKDGSFDNILDKASCLSVVLPVKVIVASKEITVNSEDDFEIIENEFDQLDTNDFSVDFIFPIQITKSDYSVVDVLNNSQLQELVGSCGNSGEDNDIECVDFKYPITYTSFDTVRELIQTKTVINDKDNFEFLTSEINNTNNVIGMKFPITAILQDGATIEISTVSALKEEILSTLSVLVCDEDDDNDFKDDDCNNCTEATLVSALTSCSTSLIVDKLIEDNVNTTSRFEGSDFVFTENGNVTIITKEENLIEGTWSSTGTKNNIQFEMQFSTGLNETFSYRLSELRMENGLAIIDFRSGSDRLQFKCSPETVTPPTDPVLLEGILINALWDVNMVTQNGEDTTASFSNYVFDFKQDKTFTATNGVETVNGQWSITVDSSNFIDLTFEETSSLTALSERYTLTFAEENRVMNLDTEVSKIILRAQ